MPRETLAVADLIPGDIVLPQGWEVLGYPHGVPGSLPGTLVPLNKWNNTIVCLHYYNDTETPVEVIRD